MDPAAQTGALLADLRVCNAEGMSDLLGASYGWSKVAQCTMEDRGQRKPDLVLKADAQHGWDFLQSTTRRT
jgi:hypothetical protein